MTIVNKRYNNIKVINRTRENLKAIQKTAKTIPDELEKTYVMTMAKNISRTTFNHLYRIRKAISPVLVSDEEFQLALDKIAAKASIYTGYNRLLHRCRILPTARTLHPQVSKIQQADLVNPEISNGDQW